ncbi:MAG: hypothetical protein HW384_720 [Dehalococcoidia bacterium]|nr:hypothetical protein [Dehalococcoidia bacterium]
MAKLGLDIKSLLKQSPEKAKDRNIKAFPMNGLWIPFFTATNATGESNIHPSALGAGLQLRVDKDGTPRLKETTDPVTGVVTKSPVFTPNRELVKAATGVMDNIAFGLITFTATIQKTHPEEYKAQAEAAQIAGAKVREHEDKTLGTYLAELAAQKMKAAAPANEVPTPSPIPDRELVPA